MKSTLKDETRNIAQRCKAKAIIANVNLCGYLKSFLNWCILLGLMKKVHEVAIVPCVIKKSPPYYHGLVSRLALDLSSFSSIVLKRNILEVSEHVYQK